MTSTAAKLAAYTLGLAAVFGAAAGIGAAVGPVGPAAASHDMASSDTASHTESHPESPMDTTQQQGTAASTPHLPGGLQISQNGYTSGFLAGAGLLLAAAVLVALSVTSHGTQRAAGSGAGTAAPMTGQ